MWKFWFLLLATLVFILSVTLTRSWDILLSGYIFCMYFIFTVKLFPDYSLKTSSRSFHGNRAVKIEAKATVCLQRSQKIYTSVRHCTSVQKPVPKTNMSNKTRSVSWQRKAWVYTQTIGPVKLHFPAAPPRNGCDVTAGIYGSRAAFLTLLLHCNKPGQRRGPRGPRAETYNT